MTGPHVMSHERAQTAAKMDAFLIDRRARSRAFPIDRWSRRIV